MSGAAHDDTTTDLDRGINIAVRYPGLQIIEKTRLIGRRHVAPQSTALHLKSLHICALESFSPASALPFLRHKLILLSCESAISSLGLRHLLNIVSVETSNHGHIQGQILPLQTYLFLSTWRSSLPLLQALSMDSERARISLAKICASHNHGCLGLLVICAGPMRVGVGGGIRSVSDSRVGEDRGILQGVSLDFLLLVVNDISCKSNVGSR